MKSFIIDEVLIYNPTLKSKKKKPIQSDIQQAKIMAFYPEQAMIQQKCNTVGMAQGVYAFCDSLLPQQQHLPVPQTITMDSCSLVQKQCQQNIWLFLKLTHDTQPLYNHKSLSQQQLQIQQGYINSTLTQQILQNLIDHFYQSLRLFYGKLSGFVFLENLSELQKILTHFVPVYHQVNSYPNKDNRLDAMSYCLKSVRAIPLDVNTTLKFDYFKNVLQSYEPTVKEIMVFANGYLAYSSLEKNEAEWWARYLLGCQEPFRFQQEKIGQRFKILTQLSKLHTVDKYGSIFNSIIYGFQQDKPYSADIRSSISTPSTSISRITPPFPSQDLLGISQQQQIQLPDIFLFSQQQQQKLKLSIFIQKSMIYLTFYSQPPTLTQLIFANRFYHDNSHKFMQKISETLGNLQGQNDVYRFLFWNQSTCVGKCTFKDWALVGNQVRYTLERIMVGKEGQVTTTYQNHWVYGVKRMNRVLVLLVPNDVPLHKLDQFAAKMTKEYFYQCFM